jgi:mycofactocin system glycosyltransferase
MRPPLPVGFRIEIDPTTRMSADGTTVWGGTPWRLLRLTAGGAQRLSWLSAGAVVDDTRSGALARRLVDTGLAHPRPPASMARTEIDVVVPVRDRLRRLDTCLGALVGLAVTVVDDGSVDGLAVAAVAAEHGARVVRREHSGGPAAARNTGLAATRRPFVAFVDSDCVIEPTELLTVAGHLADPCVVGAAPRIATDPALDLGPDEALVQPRSRVSYVPTTALVLRRGAVQEVGGFDESMRYGEDVDLVWRLVAAGGSVRYDPSVVARHDEPASFTERLARRYHYGSSIGPLSRRHGAAVAGPPLSGLVAPLRIATLRRAGVPTSEAMRLATTAPLRTAEALLKWSIPGSPQRLAYEIGVRHGCLKARTLKPLLPRVRGTEGR